MERKTMDSVLGVTEVRRSGKKISDNRTMKSDCLVRWK